MHIFFQEVLGSQAAGPKIYVPDSLAILKHGQFFLSMAEDVAASSGGRCRLGRFARPGSQRRPGAHQRDPGAAHPALLNIFSFRWNDQSKQLLDCSTIQSDREYLRTAKRTIACCQDPVRTWISVEHGKGVVLGMANDRKPSEITCFLQTACPH